jgi:hypothetical protein
MRSHYVVCKLCFMIHHRDVLLGVASQEGDWGPKSGEADQGRWSLKQQVSISDVVCN